MKSISKILCASCLLLGALSCSDDLMNENESFENMMLNETKATEVVDDNKKFSFIYKGNVYNFKYKTIDDSVVWVNDTVIYNQLKNLYKLPNLVTYMHKNGEIEYFDNNDSFRSRIHDIVQAEQYMDLTNIMSTNEYKVAPPIKEETGFRANLFLYDDDGYSGKIRRVHLKDGESETEVANLKNEYSELDKRDYDMNDKTTSFAAYSIGHEKILFEMFEDSNFENHSFSFTVYVGTFTVVEGDWRYRLHGELDGGKLCVPNLKECFVGDKHDSWNDRISSVRITAL